MRRRAITTAAVLVLAGCAWAQDQSLGDAARKAREEHAQAPHATKTLSSEGSAATPVKASDDPLEVFARARTALLADTSHSCRQESSGNSGPAPGWTKVEIMEVAGSDRRHIVADDLRPQISHGEWILIGDDAYRKVGSGPWEKLSAPEAAAAARLQIPDVFAFGFQPGDLKPMGREVLGRTPTFHYQYTAHVGDMDRTISYWIGADDSLPRRTEMRTTTRYSGTAPVWWTQSTYCTYGNVTIEAPQ